MRRSFRCRTEPRGPQGPGHGPRRLRARQRRERAVR